MTQQEYLKVMAILRTSYPGSNTLPTTQEAIGNWYDKLKDLDFTVCYKATDDYIKNNEYAPTIAGIRKSCIDEVNGFAKPWDMAWGEVMAAVSKYGTYGTLEAMQSFDELTKKSIKAVGGFYSICTTNEGRDLNYIKRDFKDNYEGYKNEFDNKVQAGNYSIAIEDKEKAIN